MSHGGKEEIIMGTTSEESLFLEARGIEAARSYFGYIIRRTYLLEKGNIRENMCRYFIVDFVLQKSQHTLQNVEGTRKTRAKNLMLSLIL